METAPISREWLVDRIGADVLDLLPKRIPPLHKEDGAHPDEVAESAGFASGRDMIDQLIGQERLRREAKENGDKRSMRKRIIDQSADAEMANPDFAVSGHQNAARQFVHST